METQQEPRFRPRVLPMPKVGDNVHLMGFHMSAVPGVVTAVDYGKRTFNVNTDGTERGHSLAFDDVRWNFADPAVEALRLQEAAWRADTSPLPEWLEEEVRYMEDIESIILNILEDNTEGAACYDCSLDVVNPKKAAKAIAEAVPHLLRWQAQQEGGKP
jgi:hypothetical protein